VVEEVLLTPLLLLLTEVKLEQVIHLQLVLLKVIQVVLVVLSQDLQVLIQQEVVAEQAQQEHQVHYVEHHQEFQEQEELV
tara:strand:- start:191 stop:430 length:240 start_codon:yes stop_codon:yes gene_type:complete